MLNKQMFFFLIRMKMLHVVDYMNVVIMDTNFCSGSGGLVSLNHVPAHESLVHSSAGVNTREKSSNTIPMMPL